MLTAHNIPTIALPTITQPQLTDQQSDERVNQLSLLAEQALKILMPDSASHSAAAATHDFSDRLALVTGASRGLGYAVAEALAAAGICTIKLLGRTRRA